MHTLPAPSRTQQPGADSVAIELAQKTPFALIAIMVHVVGIAIAALWFVAKEYVVRDDTPTTMVVSAPVEAVPEIEPPQVVDQEVIPRIKTDDFISDSPSFEPLAEETAGEADSSVDSSEFGSATIGDTSTSTALGVGKDGHFGPVVGTKSGLRVGTKYIGRFGPRRGGPDSTSSPVNEGLTLGLEWLRRHQDDDGHWDAANFMKHDDRGAPCDGSGNAVNDVGVTGLALLAFLGSGSTLKQGLYRREVRAGIKWLGEQQRADGLIGLPSSQEYMYSHAIATLALCEAYGLSDNHRPYKQKVQDALNYIAQARSNYGVWRYQPKDNDGDTSITGWMVQALLSGKEFGLQVDDNAFAAARLWFDNVTDPVTGAAGYQKRGEGSSRHVEVVDKYPVAKTESLTAVALLCRALLHDSPKEVPTMDKAAATIAKKPPVWNTTDGSIDMYYWYYGSYALFQMGGSQWTAWSNKMVEAVLKTQHRAQGDNRLGSWDPIDPWGQDGGRVYSTAMMVLCLESFFRYTRVLGAR